MSGFVGIVNLEGAPVDPDLLWRLTRSLAFRGPDTQDIRIDRNVGFGHAMLRTTFEAEREHQPCTLDGDVWITADCRVDARSDLIRELMGHGRDRVRDATDPELILHAYAAWGPDCLNHLIGDFAFAIWDGPARRLFCGRDHTGVRLFYYARAGNCLVFSNTLSTLLLHPAVSNRLNELAIADYLVIGANQDASGTSFADIRRLLPAHRMLWFGGGSGGEWNGAEPKIDRYWELPMDLPVRFRRRRDYTERFLDLLRTAMSDRMRTNRIGVMMSGGLDSAGMAAIAREVGAAVDVSAYTIVYDWLLPDRERHYAGIVASHLGIPVQFLAHDNHGLLEASGELHRIPDPLHMPSVGPNTASGGLFAAIASQGVRVALHGEGPDSALLYEPRAYLRHQFGQGHWASLLSEVASYPLLFRQIPFASRFSALGLNRAKPSADGTALSGPSLPAPLIPVWMNRGFVDRLGLKERYARLRENADLCARHPVRPLSYAGFGVLQWQCVFEANDADVTGVPVEVRNPYVDIRMVRFLLSLPVLPWCRDKYLMRRALKPYLPPVITARPKQGLLGFPNYEQWKRTGIREDLPMDLVAEYVDPASLARVPIDSPFALGDALRPRVLAFFLAHRQRVMP